MLDLLIRNATVELGGTLQRVDLGIAQGRIATIAPNLPEAPDAPQASETIDAAGRLLTPGLVETHIHLDKTCILDRCRTEQGTVVEALRETTAAKRSFTHEDVYARARRTLERCACWGTMHMRTHVEVDPGQGLGGAEALA